MKKEDYEVWSLKREFTFEEAGWLWFERQPYDYKETPPQTLRNIVTMIGILKEAASEGKLFREAMNSGVGGTKRYVQEGISSNKVSRSSLRAYAESIGQKPKFLFHESIEKQPTELEATTKEKTFKHSFDYHSVNLMGQVYTLTKAQSRVIKYLHDNYKNGTPDVGGDTILNAIESDPEDIDFQRDISCSDRVIDIFKTNKDAWKALIRCEKKGVYRLNI